MKPAFLLTCSLSVALLIGATRKAEACQLSRLPSPLEFLADESVVRVEIIAGAPGDLLARVHDVLAGPHDGKDVIVPFSDCGTLEVGDRGYLGIGEHGIATMPYHFARLPEEPENLDFYEAFAKARTARARAAVIADHVARGWEAYVDFPSIAVYLGQAPEVVRAMTRAEAKRTLTNLRRHKRAFIPAALRQRAR